MENFYRTATYEEVLAHINSSASINQYEDAITTWVKIILARSDTLIQKGQLLGQLAFQAHYKKSLIIKLVLELCPNTIVLYELCRDLRAPKPPITLSNTNSDSLYNDPADLHHANYRWLLEHKFLMPVSHTIKSLLVCGQIEHAVWLARCIGVWFHYLTSPLPITSPVADQTWHQLIERIVTPRTEVTFVAVHVPWSVVRCYVPWRWHYDDFIRGQQLRVDHLFALVVLTSDKYLARPAVLTTPNVQRATKEEWLTYYQVARLMAFMSIATQLPIELQEYLVRLTDAGTAPPSLDRNALQWALGLQKSAASVYAVGS
jgi:hypothetical protein